MRDSIEIVERMQRITALVADADGCLTRGMLGEAAPVVTRPDQFGLALAAAAGWSVLVISDQEEAFRDAVAAAIQAPVRAVGSDRLGELLAWAAEAQVPLDQVAYLGSDLPDLPAMYASGLGISPRDGALLVRKQADVILELPAGHGALRELVERLLQAQGRQCEALRAWYAACGVAQPGDWLDRLEAREADCASGKIGFRR